MVRTCFIPFLAAFFLVGCGEPPGPLEVARDFLSHLQHGQLDTAGELLAEGLEERLEDRFGNSRIIHFSIEDVAISEEGNSATIRWSMDIESDDRDSSEEGRLELVLYDDDGWRIAAF